MSLLQEALDACAALARRLERGNKVKVLKLRRLKKVGTSQRIKSSDDSDMEDASNQGRMIDELNRDEDVALMDDKGAEKKAEEAQVAGDDQVKGRQAEIYQIDMDHASKVLSIHEDEPEVQEVVDVVTTAKQITEVVTAASESVIAASTTIVAAEPQVHAVAITAASVRVVAASTKRRKGVVIKDPEKESTAIIPADTKSKDKGKGIMVEKPKPMKKKQQVKMDEEYARKLHEELNKDIDWDVAIDHVKQKAKEDPYVKRYQIRLLQGMSYDDIHPIFEAKFNSNIEFLLKSKEQIEEEDNRAIQSINETLTQKAAKRGKLNEEFEDFKEHLEIVHDKDDDVYKEATPLARKVPVFELMEHTSCIFDELTRQTVHVQTNPRPAPNLLMHRPISSGLVPNHALVIPYVPPTKKELEILFQPMFDEYFKLSTADQQVPPAPAVHILVNPPSPSVSIFVDQDALSEGHSPSSSDHQSSFVHHGVAAGHSLEVNPFTPADNEPSVDIFQALKYHHPGKFR
nr:hypothetical protein [Tanacetum cinerariifolium]